MLDHADRALEVFDGPDGDALNAQPLGAYPEDRAFGVGA